jgi:hypothetical protein
VLESPASESGPKRNLAGPTRLPPAQLKRQRCLPFLTDQKEGRPHSRAPRQGQPRHRVAKLEREVLVEGRLTTLAQSYRREPGSARDRGKPPLTYYFTKSSVGQLSMSSLSHPRRHVQRFRTRGNANGIIQFRFERNGKRFCRHDHDLPFSHSNDQGLTKSATYALRRG